MIRYLLPVFLLLLLLCSCHKISVDEIVQTDTSGNIISRGSSKDWQPANIVGNSQAASEMDIFQAYIDSYTQLKGYNSFLIKKTCTTLPDTLDIYPYANPLHNTQDLRIRVRSSVPICFFSYHYTGLNKNDGDGIASGFAAPNWLESSKTLDFNIAGVGTFPTGSMRLTFYVITIDSCSYVASGTVLVN